MGRFEIGSIYKCRVFPAVGVAAAVVAALLSQACIAGDEVATGSDESAGSDTSGNSTSEGAEGSKEPSHGVDSGPQVLGVHESVSGACGANKNEYFVVRAGLGGHSLAIDVDGNAFAWGANDKGQLGIGTTGTPELKPKKILGGQKFWDVAGGDKHTLGLAQDGTVWAWGDNSAGQIANTATFTPKKVAGLSNVVQIAAGGRFSLALTDTGKLYAWGDNTYGQLGAGSVGGTRSTPALVIGLSSPSSIAAGRDFAAGHKGGQLWVWGRDNAGQLGNGASTASSGKPAAAPLLGIYNFGLGPEHVVVYTPQEPTQFYAWGNNDSGQLGTGNLIKRLSPVQISGPPFLGVTGVIAGATSTFIAGASGFAPPKPGLEIYAAGRNEYRQILNKLPSPVTVLSVMSGVLSEGWEGNVHFGYLQQLAAGDGYTLMIVGTTVKAIGINAAGQLGDGTKTPRNTPTNVCLP